MKKVLLGMLFAGVLFAGSDIIPITDYEKVDYNKATEAMIEQPTIIDIVAPALVVETMPFLGFIDFDTSSAYMGVNIQCGEFDSVSEESCLGNVLAKAGYRFTEHIAVETQIGKGVTVSDIGEISDKVSVDQTYAIFLKVSTNEYKNFKGYGLLGYAKSDFNQDTEKYKKSSPVGGLGVEYNLGNNLALTGEVLRVIDTRKVGYDVFSVGFNYYFGEMK